MPERPLLILPIPSEPIKKSKRFGRGGKIHFPEFEKQKRRLGPQFTALQQTFIDQRVRLSTETTGIIPEEVLVLETVGTIDNFVAAVKRIDGMEWLGEIEEEDIPPDDDFFSLDSKGGLKPEKTLRGRVFLIFTNQQGLNQLLSLWKNGSLAKQLNVA